MRLPRIPRPRHPRARILLAALLAASCGGEATPAWYPSEVVDQPSLFAEGVISTQDAEEFGLTFTPNADTVYFTRRIPGERQKIWFSHFSDGSWSPPEVAGFSESVDENPWISPDGGSLYFASRRPGAFPDDDLSDNLWVMDRSGDGWSDPRPVESGVNTPRPRGARWPVGSELNPVIGPDGALYYWSRTDGEQAGPDIYRAEGTGGGFGPGLPMPPPVNSDGAESHFAFGPNGMLVFQGYGRPGVQGFEDLFLTWRTETGWSLPRVLPPPVSTEANEGFPSFTPDGRFLFFASDRGSRDGHWSIWFIDVEALADLDPA